MASTSVHAVKVSKEFNVHELYGLGTPASQGLKAPDGTKYNDLTPGSGAFWQMVNGTWVQFGAAGVANWGTITSKPAPFSAVALPGGGRTVATYQDYLANNAVPNILDYSIPNDGVTDARTSLNTLVNTTMQPNGGQLDIIGTVLIGSNMTFPANVTLNFKKGASITLSGGAVVTYNGPVTNFLAGNVRQDSAIANTSFGYQALNINTAGGNNVAVGHQALKANTAGTNNVAVGLTSLLSNTSGADNVALGYVALQLNVSGTQNVAIGSSALVNNTTGGSNVAIGHTALQANVIGVNNTAVGHQALYSNVGNANVAFGYQAGKAITSGQGNTAIGATALLWTTTGAYNTGVGIDALYTNIDGYSNTALGADAMGFSTHAYECVAVGFDALFSLTTGIRNTALGFKTLWSNLTGNYNLALGYFAGYYELGSNAFYVNGFQDRTTTALDKSQSLMYGTFAALPQNQTLAINAGVTVAFTLTTGQFSTYFNTKAASSQQAVWGTTDAQSMQLTLGNTLNTSMDLSAIEQGVAYRTLRLQPVSGGVAVGSTGQPTTVVGTLAVAQGFGCNSKAAQAAVASGGVLPVYATGAFGYDTAAHASALYAQVVAIQAALVANGIMS